MVSKAYCKKKGLAGIYFHHLERLQYFESLLPSKTLRESVQIWGPIFELYL
jgi:hypothetical protein